MNLRRSTTRARKATTLVALALASTVTTPAGATPWRVALLGPTDAPILAKLERNLTSMKLETLRAVVAMCTRDVVGRQLEQLHVGTALCTDGDQVGIWTREDDRVVLRDAVVIQGADDRAEELAAARVALELQSLSAKKASPASPEPSQAGGFTIIANGPNATLVANGEPPSSALGVPSQDTAPTSRPAPTARKRYAPLLVLGAGPALATSRDGSSFALSAEAEIGVSRYVALVPWLQFVPENRTTVGAVGTASFRPTLFGLGFAVPFLTASSVVVPRVGAGYGILWMHVAPETATGISATMRAPEDLVAPIMYATAAISVKVASSFRVVGEGMVGVSSADMVVRIGQEETAHWGVPIASLAMRGEWVLQ